jgi:mRNA-degrading endonuclease HigB of HigAB toxin-antitoxin module
MKIKAEILQQFLEEYPEEESAIKKIMDSVRKKLFAGS